SMAPPVSRPTHAYCPLWRCRASADRQLWRGARYVADGDRWGVSSCFVGRGTEVGQRCVCGVYGVEFECVGVGIGESFDEGLGAERSAAGRAGFDPCSLVYLITKRSYFTAPGSEDPAHVQRRAPVQPEAQ